MKLTVSHEFMGWGDYWGGNGRRWDADAGCVFAYYGKDTTLRDCVDQWVDDFLYGNGDFIDGDPVWDKVSDVDIRNAILDSLTEQGRADYESGALCDGAANWEQEWEPADDSLEIGDTVRIDIDSRPVEGEVVNFNGFRYIIEVDGRAYSRALMDIEVTVEDDDDFPCAESPIWVLLIEIEKDDESDEWNLCQHDDGYWLWVSRDGYEKKPYPTEEAALADNPNQENNND